MAFLRQDHLLQDGPANMAVDESLLFAAGQVPVCRVYGWSESAVTFGYFQSHDEICDAFPGRALTRRWTGGGAVEHGGAGECTYSLAVPATHSFARLRPLESYCLLHAEISAALCDVGIEAVLYKRKLPYLGQACFQHPVLGDVVLSSGQKVAGAAQRRTRQGLLIQGSIQFLHEKEVPSRFPDILSRRFSTSLVPIPEVDASGIADLARMKYGHEEWLHRVP
ncbi:MAG: lipoate-protein ligase A [Verrucomicrobiales bacterium]|jgi:lipoate-protein ligase A